MKKSSKYMDVVNAVKELIKSENIHSTNAAIAEALKDVRIETFIETNKVKGASGAHCLKRLLGKKCTKDSPSGKCECYPWAAHDHVSIWNKNGKPAMYVAQPYDLDLAELKGLVEYCEKYGLKCALNAHGSWHNPGQTMFLLINKE